MASNSPVVREDLRAYAVALITKRLERLKSRKWVLFPWLRIKWLMRKLHKTDHLLGN